MGQLFYFEPILYSNEAMLHVSDKPWFILRVCIAVR